MPHSNLIGLRAGLSILLSIGMASVWLTGCSRKSNRTTKVTVAGEATTQVEPDTALLSISVVTQSSQAVNAQQENARKSDAVAGAVRAKAGSGVEIKTSDYTLQPQYDYRDNRLPKIVGYNARNSVIVTMSDLKNVGAVIDAASNSGANSIDGISFIMRQTSPARGQALAEATQQAMNKANSIAQALGGRVMRVVEENEASTVSQDQRRPGAAEALAEGDSTRMTATPISSGQLHIKSTVQLIVEIES
ncbi:MAG TPA: SIMPL domain-containing protein [Pyrinomonadaceae bacterium]|nr:SIMPL domain-containing protein [Pyrinomonadaceae bacterium]